MSTSPTSAPPGVQGPTGTAPTGASSPPLAGPPAPGQSEPGPFTSAKQALPNVQGATAPAAWKRLTDALGKDLQGGMWRAEQARRRIARIK